MYINTIFELSMVLDHEKFQKLLSRVHKRNGHLEKKDGEYIDRSIAEKGMTAAYRDSQYKKKVKLAVNTGLVNDGDKIDPDKLIRKIDKQAEEYFDYKYRVEDFTLSEVILAADVDVNSQESVSAYLTVLQRIGKVKGFSPVAYERLDDVDNFCLDGNSNGISFLLYDLQGMCRKHAKDNDMGKKRLRTVIKASEGILRTEIHLARQKTVRDYTGTNDISDQIAELLEKRKDIFLEIFVRVVPFGDFYKKDKAVEIIRNEVEDVRLRRKMLRLLELIPEKRSLYLAQKAMNYRNMEKIMKAFEKIDVSPVTISKRQDVKYLKNVYEYLFPKE